MSKKAPATKKMQSSKKKNVIKERYIRPQNYLYAFLVLAGGILLALYIGKWYQVKHEEELMTSYLISSKTIESTITNLDDLKQISQEMPSSYFIYIGYTNDKDVYNLEKDLKRVIDKYKLNDIFYYVDVTDLKNNNENYLKEIENKLEIKNLENVPAIIYVSDGKIIDSNVLDGVNKTMLKVADLENLLDVYEFDTIK